MLSTAPAGCWTGGVKGHHAITEPSRLPEVTGRLSSCRKHACQLPGSSVFLPSNPRSFPERRPDFEQEADFSDAPWEVPGKAQTSVGAAGLRNRGFGGQPGLGLVGARWAGTPAPPGPRSPPHPQQQGYTMGGKEGRHGEASQKS